MSKSACHGHIFHSAVVFLFLNSYIYIFFVAPFGVEHNLFKARGNILNSIKEKRQLFRIFGLPSLVRKSLALDPRSFFGSWFYFWNAFGWEKCGWLEVEMVYTFEVGTRIWIILCSVQWLTKLWNNSRAERCLMTGFFRFWDLALWDVIYDKRAS